MIKIVSIASELGAFRKRNKYSQSELAEILGVTTRSIFNYEKGVYLPNGDVMDKIYDLMPYLKNGNKLGCIYDYVRIRIPNMTPEEVIEKLLGLRIGMFIHDSKGILNYNTVYELDNIKVFYDEPKLTNKGVLIELTGQGCRQFETFLIFQDREWFNFFSDCLHAKAVFNRIDLAVNDYYRFLDIPHLISKVKNGECLTKFRSWRLAGNGGFDGESQGETIYFGASQSNLQVVFYEKDYEQSKKFNIPRDLVEIKNRYEIRFLHEYAEDIISKLLETRDELKTAKNVLSNYISFRDKAETNKKYWPLNAEWSVFLDEVEDMKLEMKPKIELYEKSVSYMFHQYGGLLKTVKEVDDTLGTDELNKKIESSKMSKKHFKMMKAYLASTEEFISGR